MTFDAKGPSDRAALGLLLLVTAVVTWFVVGLVVTWLGRLFAFLLP